MFRNALNQIHANIFKKNLFLQNNVQAKYHTVKHDYIAHTLKMN